MVSWLDKRTDPTSPEDLEFLVKHYSLDCLTRILFSSEAAAVENQGDNEFSRRADKIIDYWRFGFFASHPWLAWLLNMCVFNAESLEFFSNVRHFTLNFIFSVSCSNEVFFAVCERPNT